MNETTTADAANVKSQVIQEELNSVYVVNYCHIVKTSTTSCTVQSSITDNIINILYLDCLATYPVSCLDLC